MEEPLSHSLLAGLRVGEVSGRESGRIAGELLAQLGADVRRVSAPDDPVSGFDILITSGDNGAEATDPYPAGRRRGTSAFGGVHIDISPYGSFGPCRDWTGDDATIAAHAGLAVYVGEPEREPLVPPVPIVSWQAGLAAACAALAALGGGPRTVEVAEFDVMASTHMIGLYPLAFFAGAIPRRAGRRKPAPYPFTHLPCADGWVCVAFLEGRHWHRFVEVMGSPEWTADDRYRNRRRMGEQYPDEVDALVIPWLKTKTKADLLALALAHRIPIVPLRTVDEVLASEQLADRGFWRPVETGGGRTVQAPGLPFAFTPSGAASTWSTAPLAGRLVLDLGRVASAPCIGQWLADLGADVIKVESRTHLDSTRKGRPLVEVDMEAADAGQTPNLMPFFISINRGKRSLVLDLVTDAGRSVLDRLVARADVFIENFGAGGLEKLGLGPDHLHAVRPELVVVRVSAVGQAGPEALLPGYAPHSTAAAGLDDLCRYPGGEPVGMIASNFGDVNTAAFGTLAALAGLRSGAGGTFDVSMLESNVTHLTQLLVDGQLGRLPAPSPAATYRCTGDDAWLTTSVPSPEEQVALARVVGSDDGDAVAAWAAGRDAHDAAVELQGAGVCAAPVLGAEDLLFDDHTRARDVVVEITHSVLGIVPVHGAAFCDGGDLTGVRGPSPDLGQHSSGILAELGYTDEEVTALRSAGAFDGA